MWTYRAAVLDVLDADTLRLEIDLGFHVHTQQDIRLLSVSAPELNQPGGQEATAWVRDWFTHCLPGRWSVQVATVPNRQGDEKRTFTRYLGTITDPSDGRILNADLADFLAEHPEWGSGI